MADIAQQFGENTLDEPVSETILRDVRLVRVISSISTISLCAFAVAARTSDLTYITNACFFNFGFYCSLAD